MWWKRKAIDEAALRRLVRSAAVGKIVCKAALRSLSEPGMRARLMQMDLAFTNILDEVEKL